eukprot:CAMPEP_0118705086 /NCGR_PEP_ID=MMETSP0800-20121206/19651_1 /TAXON_ID=210618 ORGANISM="Striatella unipunctata, Strain CCMP2910" /NCGR_SAMPLE_ID=MMETSP0800 /ASSEMBLY_ACC=CAM_ASM_000638 /LENGTH=398 /DNA_ID=CAMNT_0006607159 /DNA_START=146 /DNA_END=1339 /DNA_ORIENTATION=+
MTTKIPFSDIIKSVKVFLNFHPDSFPIIFSLENHCSIPYQEVMAEQMTSILGSNMYIPSESSLQGQLPSPMSLQGMVVLKGRRPKDTVADGEETDDESDTASDAMSLQEQKSMQEHKPEHKQLPQPVKRAQEIAPQLARLTLFHGTKFRNWDESLSQPLYHMHSFSESKVRHICRGGNHKDWMLYNQSHMSRIYPSGSRVDSSNYNPMVAWSTGSQMVALNFQTSDAHLRLNDGRFRENGGCGYVLKPSTMMMMDFIDQPVSVMLSIRVLSGSCIPKAKGGAEGGCVDPFVKVSVFDVQGDEKGSSTTYTTPAASSNGFFPIWNHDRFVFTVENGTVGMLQLSVWDKTDFIASSSIPVSCLRRGFRSVRLFDANNTQTGPFDFASLLIEVKMKRILEE